MSRILMIVTANDRLGDTGKPTGVWLEELAAPYYAFADAGHSVTVATEAGAPIPVDPGSDLPDEEAPAAVRRFRADGEAMALLRAPADLNALDPTGFDAVFVPGGHGVMWDLAASDRVARALGSAWDRGAVVASVCHGPAAFVNVRDAAGSPIVRGRRVTGFSNAEEMAVGLDQVVPFALETRLRELGADYVAGPDWQAHAVVDGRLVTGQNPASSEAAAELVLEALAA